MINNIKNKLLDSLTAPIFTTFASITAITLIISGLSNTVAFAAPMISDSLIANYNTEKQIDVGLHFLQRYDKSHFDLDYNLGVGYLQHAADKGSDKAKALLSLVKDK